MASTLEIKKITRLKDLEELINFSYSNNVDVRDIDYKKIHSVFAIYNNHCVVGTALIVLEAGKAWLKNVYVNSELRNSGLGTELLTYMLKACQNADLAALYVKTTKPQTLYTRLGWHYHKTESMPINGTILKKEI